MKHKILLFLVCLLLPLHVYADEIYNVKIDAYIDQFGDMHVTESFSARANEGNKWCKTFELLDNQEISDITVYMDDEMLFTSSSSSYTLEKEGNNQILCFDKANYNHHEYIIDYKLSNMIIKTDNEDILYWKAISNISANNLNIIIMGYYDFENNLDMYNFGYQGIISLSDGKIYSSNQEKINDGYATIIAKFPKNTFDTTNTYEKYDSLTSVLNEVNNDNINVNDVRNKKMLFYVLGYIGFALVIISIIITSRNITYNKYGYKNNITINKKKIESNKIILKNIYYSNTLLRLNNIDYLKTNIFGAILSKLLTEEKIKITDNKIDLTTKPRLTNEYEKELFEMLYEASKDGYLTINELEKWTKKDYNKLLNLFNYIVTDNIYNLEDSCRIYKRKYKKECHYKKVMDGVLYKDSLKLYGLENYLNEYINKNIDLEESKIKDYITYSFLFGINNKFIKKLVSNYQEYSSYLYIDNFTKKVINYLNKLKEEEK